MQLPRLGRRGAGDVRLPWTDVLLHAAQLTDIGELVERVGPVFCVLLASRASASSGAIRNKPNRADGEDGRRRSDAHTHKRMCSQATPSPTHT